MVLLCLRFFLLVYVFFFFRYSFVIFFIHIGFFVLFSKYSLIELCFTFAFKCNKIINWIQYISFCCFILFGDNISIIRINSTSRNLKLTKIKQEKVCFSFFFLVDFVSSRIFFLIGWKGATAVKVSVCFHNLMHMWGCFLFVLFSPKKQIQFAAIQKSRKSFTTFCLKKN